MSIDWTTSSVGLHELKHALNRLQQDGYDIFAVLGGDYDQYRFTIVAKKTNENMPKRDPLASMTLGMGSGGGDS